MISLHLLREAVELPPEPRKSLDEMPYLEPDVSLEETRRILDEEMRLYGEWLR